jgi:hypothetical protein
LKEWLRLGFVPVRVHQHQQRGADRALVAVGGTIHDLASDEHRGRTTAVEVQSIGGPESPEEIGELPRGHPDRTPLTPIDGHE